MVCQTIFKRFLFPLVVTILQYRLVSLKPSFGCDGDKDGFDGKCFVTLFSLIKFAKKISFSILSFVIDVHFIIVFLSLKNKFPGNG